MNNKFRNYLINILLLLFYIATPWVAFSQAPINSIAFSDLPEKRFTKLEHVVNAHGQLLAHFQQQLSNNQNDLDLLRGQIQESQYKINQIIANQKQLFPKCASIPVNIAKKFTTDNLYNNSLTAMSDTNDYHVGISLAQDKFHLDDAILTLKDFIKKYPHSVYQANVNYWLGQLSLNKNKKNDAAFYFASVVKNYPKSSYASSSMFKIGTLMQDKGEISKAKAIYQQVIENYPNTDSAKQAQKYLNNMK